MSQPARKRRLVDGWMTTQLIAVAPDAPLFEAVERMAEQAVRHVLVLEGEELVGILSNRDLVRATLRNAEQRLDLHAVSVGQVMTKDPYTIEPEATIEEAAGRMVEHTINALPVVQAGRPAGIVTSDDLLRALSTDPVAAPYL